MACDGVGAAVTKVDVPQRCPDMGATFTPITLPPWAPSSRRRNHMLHSRRIGEIPGHDDDMQGPEHTVRMVLRPSTFDSTRRPSS